MLINDPLYIGLREQRYPRQSYDELVEEFLGAVKTLYGPQTLVMVSNATQFTLHIILLTYLLFIIQVRK